MTTINVRQKGADGERELATDLNLIINMVRIELGMKANAIPEVQRNQNQSAVGGNDLTGTYGYAIEVKRQEALSIPAWWRQCVKSAEHLGEVPVLIFRQSRKPWRVIMQLQARIEGTDTFAMVVGEISYDEFKRIFKQTVMAHYRKTQVLQMVPSAHMQSEGLFPV